MPGPTEPPSSLVPNEIRSADSTVYRWCDLHESADCWCRSAQFVYGDCLIAPLPDVATLVYADPPYGTGVTRRHSSTGYGYGDLLTGPRYIEWVTVRLARAASCVTDGWLVVQQDPVVGIEVAHALSASLGAPAGVVQWQDGWVSGFRSRAAQFWPRVHDSIYFWRIGKATFTVTGDAAPEGYKRRGGGEGMWRPHGDVWVGPWSPGQLSFSKEKVGYPDQKPLALLERIITATTAPGDIVLDPFCGSGTSVVAAQFLDRLGYGIDTNPSALSLAASRCYRTDPNAVRIGTSAP